MDTTLSRRALLYGIPGLYFHDCYVAVKSPHTNQDRLRSRDPDSELVIDNAFWDDFPLASGMYTHYKGFKMRDAIKASPEYAFSSALVYLYEKKSAEFQSGNMTDAQISTLLHGFALAFNIVFRQRPELRKVLSQPNNPLMKKILVRLSDFEKENN